jgi:hypothetical protein
VSSSKSSSPDPSCESSSTPTGNASPRDDELVSLLATHRDRVEVYLQYDGESSRCLGSPPRGQTSQVQGRRIERLSGSGIFTDLDDDRLPSA